MTEDDGEEPVFGNRTPTLGVGAKVNRVGGGMDPDIYQKMKDAAMRHALHEQRKRERERNMIPRSDEHHYLAGVAAKMGGDFKTLAPSLYARYEEYQAIEAWYKTRQLLGATDD